MGVLCVERSERNSLTVLILPYSSFSQVEDESNVLLDGSLIDLCGAVLLWRSTDGLKEMAVCLKFFILSRLLIKSPLILNKESHYSK